MVLLMNSFEDMIKEAELASRKTEAIIYDEFNNTGIECVNIISLPMKCTSELQQLQCFPTKFLPIIFLQLHAYL